MTKTLYEMEYEGKVIFVEVLTTASDGLKVVEVLPGRDVMKVESSKLKKVVPYSVQIGWFSGPAKHYKVKKGTLNVDDLVFDQNSNLGRVKAIDTENEGAEDLVAWKIASGTLLTLQ